MTVDGGAEGGGVRGGFHTTRLFDCCEEVPQWTRLVRRDSEFIVEWIEDGAEERSGGWRHSRRSTTVSRRGLASP